MKRSNSSRFWLNIELERFSSTVPAGHRVLDAGSGDQRYSRLFQHCKYKSVDFEQVNKRYTPSTYVCDLSAIPVKEGRYDVIIFTQVMEHLPDSDGVVSLMH